MPTPNSAPQPKYSHQEVAPVINRQLEVLRAGVPGTLFALIQQHGSQVSEIADTYFQSLEATAQAAKTFVEDEFNSGGSDGLAPAA